MKRSEVTVLESTQQKTHAWLKELSEMMGSNNQQQAYLALRAVLQALRDRLPVEVVAKLGAQLPLLIRGVYYEGWVPSATPIKVHNIKDFLLLVSMHLGNKLLVPETELLTKSVLKLMNNHLSKGEIQHLKSVLPKPIATFWTVCTQ